MLPNSIVRLVDAFAAATGRRPSAIGRSCGGTGDFYRRLVHGHDITTRRAARVVEWLSDHWPPDADWPPDIPRPAPSPGSPAATPPEPASDPSAPTNPIAAVEAAQERLEAAMFSGERMDVAAAHAIEREMFAVACRLGPDGRLASPGALCRALSVPRYVYDDVVRRYRDSAATGSRPRSGSRCAKVLAALVAAGDVRFARRRPRAAA